MEMLCGIKKEATAKAEYKKYILVCYPKYYPVQQVSPFGGKGKETYLIELTIYIRKKYTNKLV